MNASKENTRKARRFFRDIRDGINEGGESLSEHMRDKRLEFLAEFIDACERKLPTEDAYQRETKRRQKV